jgi:hypothetical protein
MEPAVELRLQLAAALGNDLGNETIPNSAVSKAFPNVGDGYGYAEIYWFLSLLSDAVVSCIEDRFDHLDDFWDYWNEEVEKAGVFVYDASDELLKRLALLPKDPVNFGDPDATARKVAAETVAYLLDGTAPVSELPTQITHILTP